MTPVNLYRKHPDKGGNNEEFKELYSAYDMIGKLIESEASDTSDQEEDEARKRFREENWSDVNSTSITIKIKTIEGSAWEETL